MNPRGSRGSLGLSGNAGVEKTPNYNPTISQISVNLQAARDSSTTKGAHLQPPCMPSGPRSLLGSVLSLSSLYYVKSFGTSIGSQANIRLNRPLARTLLLPAPRTVFPKLEASSKAQRTYLSLRVALPTHQFFETARISMLRENSISRIRHALSSQASQEDVPVTPPKLWNIPNILSVARVVLVPVFIASFYYSGGEMLTTSIFLAACITDFLDGYLARKWNICSPFGAFVDPVADKLMVSTALILLAGAQGPLIAIPTAIILSREIAVSALREWMAELGQRSSVAVGWSGKVKTACQMIALTGLLASRSALWSPLYNISYSLLMVATLLTMFSGSQLFAAAWPTLSRRG
ncbi:hypothetical protein AAMO2058_000070300 [Amorphochlora amoebiformis]